jgi:hypothetical protein
MTRSFNFLSEIGADAPLPEVIPMPAPAQIRGLADTLRDQLKRATARATEVGERARSSVGNLHAVLDQAESVVTDVDKAAAEVQAALGLGSNGGPALDENPTVAPDTAPPSEQPSVPSGAQVTMQRSPIGFVARRT